MERGSVGKASGATHSVLSEGEMWQEAAASLHGAVRRRGHRHVHVGPEPAFGPVGSTQCFSVYAWVYLHVRGFVHTRRPRLDAEQQGNPKTTQFFILCFLSVTFSILNRSLPQPFFSFSHLVLGMSHLTELLGHLGLNGFYSFTGNHLIPPTHLQLQYHSFQCR